jgi:hypothetical protein
MECFSEEICHLLGEVWHLSAFTAACVEIFVAEFNGAVSCYIMSSK